MHHGRLWGILFLATGLAWAGLPLPPAHLSDPGLRKPDGLPASLATWNLEWFPGNQPQPSDVQKKRHEKDAAQWIRRLGVDLLVLQEVVDTSALARVTSEYPWRVVSDFQRAGDESPDLPVQNVAVLSKVPIRESWQVGFHALPLTPDRPVRGFLGVRLGRKSGGMTVYTLHLKSNRGGREASARRRERAMEYLRKDWQQRGLDPSTDAVVVAGDFNCSVKNPEFAEEETVRSLRKEGWTSVTGDMAWPQAGTVRPDPDGKYPASDFDHILLSPGWWRRHGRPKGGTWMAGILRNAEVPSDHFPVWLKRVEGSVKGMDGIAVLRPGSGR